MKNLPQNTTKSQPYEPSQYNTLPHTEPSRQQKLNLRRKLPMNTKLRPDYESLSDFFAKHIKFYTQISNEDRHFFNDSQPELTIITEHGLSQKS